jgi:hypothetical protein
MVDPASDVRHARRQARRCIAVALELRELERQLPIDAAAPLASAMALQMRQWFDARAVALEGVHGRVPEEPVVIHPRKPPREKTDAERALENLKRVRGRRG